ncbi:MAG: winged helix-turn-helix transcriptional regulator [Candidatus Paceibacterota bacterium]
MLDDTNTTQNQGSEEASIPTSFQEPTEPALENTTHSEPSDVLPETLESSPNDFLVKSKIIPPLDSTPTEAENEPKIEEKQNEIPVESTDLQANPVSNGTSKPNPEPVSEPVQATEPLDSANSPQTTAQMIGNEPLTSKLEIKTEPNIQEVKLEPVSVPNSGESSEAKPEPEKVIPVPVIISNKNKIIELLLKAKNAIQFRKRKKLEKVMTLFLKKSKITNDEVEKLLHISDATATRYLSQLEKEGKIKQNGKTGKGVSYSRI